MVGATVSYILSRWAWERKGRPHVLKETLPFWAVSVGAWIVLGLASHYASVWAISAGLGHWQRVAVVNTAYLLANCVTFVTRFAIIHYVLFADRGPRASFGPGPGPSAFTASDGNPVPAVVTRDGSAAAAGRRLATAAPALAPPSGADHLHELQGVEGVIALLALADLALVDGSWPLDYTVSVRDHADQQFGCLILRLL